jgi:hypothetical protein
MVVVVYNESLISTENAFLSLTAFQLTASMLLLLMRVSIIYTQQQKHLRVLDEAQFKAMFNAARIDPGSNTLDLVGLLDATQKQIKGEADCPHVMGFSVKPTFFYFVMGYAVTAVIAIAGKDIADKER